MLDVSYGITRTLEGVTFEDARRRVEASLQNEGFGVLTEIDVKATLKKKLDQDFRKYVILGACNPPIAHQVLTLEPAIGLLLPCNVVVTEDDDGNAIISAMDPAAMVRVVPDPGRLEGPMGEARTRIRRAVENA